MLKAFALVDFCAGFWFCGVCRDPERGRRIRKWLLEHCCDLADGRWVCPYGKDRPDQGARPVRPRRRTWADVVEIIGALPAGGYEDDLRDLLRVTRNMLELHADLSACWKGRQKRRVCGCLDLYLQRKKGGV